MEVERTEAHPDLGAVDVAPDPWEERHEEQQQTDQPERPLESLQVAHAAHDDEREHVRADAHRGPVRLQRGEMLVEARDEHVADAVEKHRERQQGAVGTRRKTSRRDVRDEEQHEHLHEEGPDVRGERGGPAEGAQGVEPGDDQRSEDEERQLGAAPVHQGVTVAPGTPTTVVTGPPPRVAASSFNAST